MAALGEACSCSMLDLLSATCTNDRDAFYAQLLYQTAHAIDLSVMIRVKNGSMQPDRFVVSTLDLMAAIQN